MRTTNKNKEPARIYEESPTKRVVDMIHHSPTIATEVCNPHYLYSQDILYWFHGRSCSGDMRQVKIWAFGYTHFDFDFQLDGIRAHSNQQGNTSSLSEGFDKRKLVTI
jgi:hypothetical protein